MRLVALLSVLVLGVACTDPSGVDEGRDRRPTDRQSPITYVAVGASETVGVGATHPSTEAWPEVLRRDALPPDTTFVNVGVSGSTVAQALTQQLPRAFDVEPDLVTVWLNVNDALRFVPISDYERDLATLVGGLRRGGAAQVLLANTPPLEDLPVVRACLPDPPPGVRCLLPVRLPGPEPVIAYVRQFNEVIGRVASQEGAVLVDLHAAAVADRQRRLDRYLASDGFHPSTEGHAAVAAVFAAALRSTPVASAGAGTARE